MVRCAYAYLCWVLCVCGNTLVCCWNAAQNLQVSRVFFLSSVFLLFFWSQYSSIRAFCFILVLKIQYMLIDMCTSVDYMLLFMYLHINMAKKIVETRHMRNSTDVVHILSYILKRLRWDFNQNNRKFLQQDLGVQYIPIL